MLDPKRILKAEADGVAFVCRMCTRWYQGEDMGLVDVEGDQRCATIRNCGSPIGGKCFHDYDGPLKGYLANYCYVCGKSHPQKALKPNIPDSQPIGCCDYCFENVVQKLALRQPGRRIIFTTAERAGPDRFEARQ